MKAKRKLTLSITLVAALLMALLTAGTVLASEGDDITVTGFVMEITEGVDGNFILDVDGVLATVDDQYTVYVGANFNFDSIVVGDEIEVTGVEGEDPLIIILSELKIQERLKDQVKLQDGEGDAYFCAAETDKIHPIAEKIALTYEGVEYADILAYLCSENPVSLGQIMLALQTAALTGEDFTVYLTGDMDEFHWGQIWQDFDVDDEFKGKPDKGNPPGQIQDGDGEGNEDQGQKNKDGEEDSGGFLGLISKWLQKGKK